MKNCTAKKAASVFIAAALALSFCACGADKSGKSTQSSSEAVAANAEKSSVESSERTEDSAMTETAQSSVKESSEESSKAEEKSKAQKSSKAEEKSQAQESSKAEEKSQAQESSRAEEKSQAQESSRTEEKSQAQENSRTEEQSKAQESRTEQSSEPSQAVQSSPEIEVTGIALSDSSITLYKGYTYTLTAQLMPANATNRNFNWNWSDKNIISVNSYGTITAKAIGHATVTAQTPNNKTATCEVNVIEKPVQQSSQPVQQPQSSQTQTQQQSKPVTQAPTGTYVGSSWFDDAVFVGDSVSVKLQYYAENGCLGKADFLCAVSLGYNNSLWDLNRPGNVHPLYQGKKVTVDEGVKLCGKKKVFIMLGMNDVGTSVEYAIGGMKQLTDRILQKSPDVQIYIQSVTPLLKTIVRSDRLNNTNVAKFNEAARRVCDERGFIFVNVAEAVDDGNGNLLYENCGDPGYMGLHFSYTGCSKWVDYLKRHVA